jgi:hypothetical protein
MALSAVRHWFGRYAPPPGEVPPPMPKVEPALAIVPPLPAVMSRPPPAWSRDRLITTDALWGEGYQFPGGEIETLRLAKPLGLSKASSLLLIGAGAGGAACSLAVQLGVWVSGFESDPTLVAAAVDRIARRNLTKHAQIELWNPAEPRFREGFYHHGLLLEPLRGSQPEGTLSAIAKALKKSGHLMMMELVADKPLDPSNPAVSAWAHLERRDPRTLPTEVTITRTLGRLGFDVRVCEDVSERHMNHALSGWRSVVRTMEEVLPDRRQVMRSVQEAELWLTRIRLFQAGSLRLLRWHGIGGG